MQEISLLKKIASSLDNKMDRHVGEKKILSKPLTYGDSCWHHLPRG